MTAGLQLSSDCLCSKWGFNDGDMPDEVWDLLDEHGIDYSDVDWHSVLRRLVREHLLPELAKHHQVEVYDIETIHNPIRASVIDGQLIDHHADDQPVLTPTGVWIPMHAVLAVIKDEVPALAGGVVAGEVVSVRWGPRQWPGTPLAEISASDTPTAAPLA